MMKKQSLQVKGMVCDRCISTVRSAMQELDLKDLEVSLGEISYVSEVASPSVIQEKLQGLGLTVLKCRNAEIVKAVKTEVAKIYNGDFDFPESFRFAIHISSILNLPYDTISQSFITEEKQTIEQ